LCIGQTSLPKGSAKTLRYAAHCAIFRVRSASKNDNCSETNREKRAALIIQAVAYRPAKCDQAPVVQFSPISARSFAVYGN
jgi:hypothetical protein